MSTILQKTVGPMITTTSGDMTAQLAANPKLMRAYQCVREAFENIDQYISREAPKSGTDKGEIVWKVYHELDGVLPNFWSNLALMIVADINSKITGEGTSNE